MFPNVFTFMLAWSPLHPKTTMSLAGKYLSILPVDPKLGKMLIMGAIFRCFDPILTIVSALSVKDPFLLPQDKKDVSDTLIHLSWIGSSQLIFCSLDWVTLPFGIIYSAIYGNIRICPRT